MKKLPSIVFTSLAILCMTVLVASFMPQVAHASVCPGYQDSLVQCGQEASCRCEITDFFQMLVRVYRFGVIYIAFPLLALTVVIGGVMLVISAGSPGLAQQGKNIIKYSVIGVALVLGSYLIIDILLRVLGATVGGGPWWQF